MCLSVRGIARRYRNVTGNFSVVSAIFGTNPVRPASLRNQLVVLARRVSQFLVTQCGGLHAWPAVFEQTWSVVCVRVRLGWDAGISDEDKNRLRTDWEGRIKRTWSDRWGVECAGESTCSLQFDVEWVDSYPHYIVTVLRPPPTAHNSNMTTWYTDTSPAATAHEFGHMLGLVDEYQTDQCPDRDPVNTKTVMDNNSMSVPARMMQRFADNIGCTVVPIWTTA